VNRASGFLRRRVPRNRPRAALVIADGEERHVAEQVVRGANHTIEAGFGEAEIRQERGGIGGLELRDFELDLHGDDLKRLRGFQFLSAKPLLIVINLDESAVNDGNAADAVDHAAERAGLTDFLSRGSTAAVAVCAKIELEIAQLDAADAAAFLADLGLKESGLDRVIRASYELLGYISFFTVGEDECRAWSIPRNLTAPLAAGEIHSDIQRGFIRAEVVSYDALIARGSMAVCRDHGEVRLEGKDYIVLDGDIINFRHAT